MAEEVATIDPDLVARDGDGKLYTVRYESVSAAALEPNPIDRAFLFIPICSLSVELVIYSGSAKDLRNQTLE